MTLRGVLKGREIAGLGSARSSEDKTRFLSVKPLLSPSSESTTNRRSYCCTLMSVRVHLLYYDSTVAVGFTVCQWGNCLPWGFHPESCTHTTIYSFILLWCHYENGRPCMDETERTNKDGDWMSTDHKIKVWCDSLLEIVSIFICILILNLDI